MDKKEHIIVLYKPHGTKVSIMRKQYDSQVHQLLDVKPVKTKNDVTPTKDTKKTLDANTVPPVVTPVDDAKVLLDQYEERFGKRPVGKWAKDIKWLNKKLNA